MRLFLVCLALLPALLSAQGGNAAFYQSQGNQFSILTSPDTRQFELRFAILKNEEPDALVAVFNVVQLGETVSEVNENLNARLATLKKDLVALGIRERDIFVDMVSQVPLYTYETERKLFSKNYVEVPSGFELQKNVHVRFEDPALLDQIATAASKQEIHDLAKVDYYVDEPDAVYAELRKEAIRLFEARKAHFESLDISLDSVFHTISESRKAHLPLSRYASYEAVQQYGYRQGSKTTVKARKPSTRYYNPVSYADFDKVINPQIVGPVVQFTYQLVVRYTLDDPYLVQTLMLTDEGVVLPVVLPKE
ncbi:MAG: SIMPL domain-containing protein, partial [Bacteroidota bacterium]